jgi:hypothetical protein
MWRKTGGTQISYLAWKNSFGSSGGAGGNSSSGVPEPHAVVLTIAAACFAAFARSRHPRQFTQAARFEA